MAVTKTEYVTFEGTAYWAKVYKPDEFRGAVRWTLNLHMDDEEMWKKYKDLGIQKKINENENGKYFAVSRPTTKLIKGNVVNFTPPIIYDKDGNELVKYVDEEGKIVRSFDDPKMVPQRVGNQVLIGNGSKVAVTLCVYPTSMGPGNRLESIRILDLVSYEPPESDEAYEAHTKNEAPVRPKW